MKKEIQILLGLNCNFSCSHCLNNSRPGYKTFDIKSDEIQKLTEDIKRDSNVSLVSFSGGEPLLYLEEISTIIQSLRNLKNRQILFSITTNGSLIKNFSSKIKSLSIDFCTVSYDYGHSRFIDEQALSKSLALAKELFGKLEINFVYKDLAEIALIKSIAMNFDVKVNFNRTIHSGRASTHTSHTNYSRKFQCPNISSELLKITYIPSMGYSVCCGPIIFDNLIPNEYSFSKQHTQIELNTLFKFLKTSELSGQEVHGDEVACNKCRSLILKKFTDFTEAT